MKRLVILGLVIAGLSVSGCSNKKAMHSESQEVKRNIFKKECVSGDKDGCKNYFNVVVESYKKKCDNGDAESCTSLWSVYMHSENLGIPKDIYKADKYLKKGVELYRKSCDGGNGGACLNYKLYKNDLLK